MEEKKLVPKKRFKGFIKYDEWTKISWQDNVDISTNMVNPREEKYKNLLHIGPGNIESFTGLLLNNVKTVKEDNLISGKFYFDKDDIIYGKINPQLGKYTYALHEGLASADAYVLNAKNQLNQRFLFMILQRKDFFNYSVSVSKRSGMPKINRDELNEYWFYAPNLKEQEKIGEFFKVLDERIANQERKIAKVKALKEAYLTEMFPQEGETVPRQRFKGFEGEWRKYQLKELGVFTSNGVNKKINANESKVNLLNYMDVYKRRKITNENAKELMQVTANEGQILNNNVLKNDIFFTPTSETPEDIGRVMVIEETLHNTVYSYHLMRYRPKEFVFYSIFPNYLLDTKVFRKQLMFAAQGVQRYVLNRDAFENLSILLPTIEEQAKIGEFFKNLDGQIEAEEKKLEKLKKTKEAYLEEMFV